VTVSTSRSAIAALCSRRSLRPAEALPWLIALGAFFALPAQLPLATQTIVMILFALSLDLLVGYTGIVTLGHAAYFGVGAYTAGILAVAGWNDPLLGLVAAMIVAGVVGAITGIVILRTRGLTLLMIGLAVTLLLGQVANHWPLTGGADGLQGITLRPILGMFDFGLSGRVGFVYAVVVLFLAWVFVRQLVHSPFGRSLVGIKESETRMLALGVPVLRRKFVIFTIAAMLAGLAGALSAQTNQFVGLNVLSFELSGTVLVVVVLGGIGRLYGAFLGAPIYVIAQDALAKSDPVYWLFWFGLMLVAVVLFARGGILGIVDLVWRRLRAPVAARRLAREAAE
jgi:branched-chain amino acid transport system permease protein